MSEGQGKSREQQMREIEVIMEAVDICNKEGVDQTDYICPTCGGQGIVTIISCHGVKNAQAECQIEKYYYHLRLSK